MTNSLVCRVCVRCSHGATVPAMAANPLKKQKELKMKLNFGKKGNFHTSVCYKII